MIITAWPGWMSPGCEIHDQVICRGDYKSRCPLSQRVSDTNQRGFRTGQWVLLFFSWLVKLSALSSSKMSEQGRRG